ncbi:CREB/ATF bZIP transcription factor isoform X2 [Lampris incognitus]|uniref:CREB/ATF bZIP transcription factor isoform X2 n=1 Tax=Lampris incognitus TaxID=2546036 RepID=UPI0024B4D033|nr:CREB/ATF bZIP transcription factor isoform X2 [Lampris incognitus]
MITRRKGLTLNNVVQHLDGELTDAIETVESLQSPSEWLPTEDANSELDDLFGIEDFKWTFERDTDSPFFDMGLGMYSSKDRDSSIASKTPSPERVSSDSKTKRRHSPSGHIINKNAIAARLNRLKKKEYINGLEKQVGFLSTENHMLKQENSQLTKRVEELEDETRYLRAVLANESMLAQLLSRLSGVNGMKLSSSLLQGPNSNDYDHDYALPRKRVKVEEKETSAGVCLHVDKNHVSVEFCTKCAESASSSLKM